MWVVAIKIVEYLSDDQPDFVAAQLADVCDKLYEKLPPVQFHTMSDQTNRNPVLLWTIPTSHECFYQ